MRFIIFLIITACFIPLTKASERGNGVNGKGIIIKKTIGFNEKEFGILKKMIGEEISDKR